MSGNARESNEAALASERKVARTRWRWRGCLWLAALAASLDPLDGSAATGCVSDSAHAGSTVRWARREGPERADLDRWRDGVGPALAWGPSSDPTTAGAGVDALHVIVWNTHVGFGSIEQLVADLRSGALTGGVPIEHFALLLQEVHRGGESVPPKPPPRSFAARTIRPGGSASRRRGIEEIARSASLSLYYVPSMRNGRGASEPEDRGNAILATLPLANLTAVELPLERERRVAISADISGTTTAGTPWRLRLVNLHLDARSSWRRLYRSLGAGRLGQVRWLLEALGDDGGAGSILGGDFNSWVGGADEPAVRLVRQSHWLPSERPTEPTQTLPVLGRTLDHLLYRLPSGAAARTRVLEAAYGSDHRPLLGWVRPAAY